MSEMKPAHQQALEILDRQIAADPRRPVTFEVFAALVRAFVERVGDLEKFAAEMNTKNVERNARLDALEARGPALKYCGVYDPQGLYAAGDVVSHQGSAWVCKQATTGGAPHDGSDAWQLCVKRGRDGRDGKDLR